MTLKDLEAIDLHLNKYSNNQKNLQKLQKKKKNNVH